MVRGSTPAKRITRDSVLFLAGLAGIVHETVVAAVDRPTLLILFGGMVGLPVFLRTDEKANDDATPPQPPVAQQPAHPPKGDT